MKYSTITEIGEYIRGKSVAIVGNAKSLFKHRYGKKIDTHEVVIRFNRGFIHKKISQGSKTTVLLLACEPTPEEISSYNAKFVCNRSSRYKNKGYTLSSQERLELRRKLGAQPSTGFMAIDICLYFGATKIDLFGFDWGQTQTFYNPSDYKTLHNYPSEEEIIKNYQQKGLLDIHKS